MPTRRLELSLPPGPIIAAGLALCAAVGLLLARDAPMGIGLLLAALYVPLALIDLPLAMAAWATVMGVEHLSFVSIGPNAAGLMILAAWWGTAGQRAQVAVPLARRHRALVAATVGLLVWCALSTVWAQDAADALDQLWRLVVALVVFMVVATAALDRRGLVLLIGGFVAGTVLSVLIGFAGGAGTHFEGRLSGGAGDPNYLAATVVPAIALAGGLMVVLRSAGWRLLLIVATAICAIGLAASQSRGGIVAAVAAVVAALVIVRRQRAALIGVLLLIGAGAALWLAANPHALERIVSADDGGTGRTELWSVASQMSGDHPLVGVGLGNFLEHSPEYAARPGNRDFGELLTERPTLVHDLYLQTLAETGAVGLALLVVALGAALAATWGAIRLFEQLGERRLAELGRLVLVAQLAVLAASVFLSNLTDKRLWFLLALGPALFGLAQITRRRGSPQPDTRSGYRREGLA